MKKFVEYVPPDAYGFETPASGLALQPRATGRGVSCS